MAILSLVVMNGISADLWADWVEKGFIKYECDFLLLDGDRRFEDAERIRRNIHGLGKESHLDFNSPMPGLRFLSELLQGLCP